MSRPSLAVLVASFLLASLVAKSPASAATLKVPQQFATIQDAIDAAGVGDVVLVAKGVYSENVFLKSDVTLVGKPGAIIDGGGIDSALTVGFAERVAVRRFTVRNTGVDPGILVGLVNDVEVSGCRVDGVNGHGIAVVGATNVRILDNRVTAAGVDGIHVETDYALVSGNTVRDSFAASIEVVGNFNTIVDNVCESASGPVSLDIGTGSAGNEFNLVVGNAVRKPSSTPQDGIGLTAPNSCVIDNAILGAFSQGVATNTGSDGLVLQDNRVKDPFAAGFLVFSARTSLLGNRVSGSDDMGIGIIGDEVYAYRNSVKKSGGAGFWLSSASSSGVLVQNSATGSATFDLNDLSADAVLIDNHFPIAP